MDLDDNELFMRCIEERKRDRILYYEKLYEKYVVNESLDYEIDLKSLQVVGNRGSSKQMHIKPFGFVTQYKSKKGRETLKILKRRVRIYRKSTAVIYESENEVESNLEQSLEISNNVDKKYCSTLGIKECFVNLTKLKEIGESSSKIYRLTEDKVLQLNCKTPKRKTLKNSKLNIDADTLIPIDTLSLTPKLSQRSTNCPMNLTESSTVLNKSAKKQLPILKESNDINYFSREKSDSVLCRSPVSACSLGLRQLKITADSDGYNTDRLCKPNEYFQSSYIKRLINDLEFPKIQRRLFKTPENKVIKNELHSINSLKGNMANISKVTDMYHKSSSPVFNGSCYPKAGKKIIKEVAIEEDIYYEDVMYMSTSASPKNNSYNKPLLKSSTIKPLPCSPVTVSPSPKEINLKSMKIIIKDNSRINI